MSYLISFQGRSVADVFFQDPHWKIRGLTRNTTSQASQSLAAKGIEIVQADLHDPSTLIPAFKGANLIFSVTDFWAPYYNPANRARANELGKSIGEYCYDLEVEQGRNIADAAAEVVDGLDEVSLVASTLSHARKCSGGKYQEVWHFDAKADVFPDYVESRYPELAKKMSYMQTGMFMSSWRLGPRLYFAKVTLVLLVEVRGWKTAGLIAGMADG